MPRKYTKITPEIVKKVYEYLNDPRGFKKIEIARLVGISENSLKRIIQGAYDQPSEQQNTETQAVDSSQASQGDRTITEIPFEELETLMKCKVFIEELFSIAKASDKDPDELYFPRHYVYNMCLRYFPDMVKEAFARINDTSA